MKKLFYFDKSLIKEENKTYTYDVVVYGATPAGITAAIQAKRQGKSCAIVELGNHIGGMTTAGLGATDLGSPYAVGGLSREFYDEVAKYYGVENQYKFEPKVAKQIFNKWLEENEVDVFLLNPLNEVIKNDTKIIAITTLNNNTFNGKVFIDASYEGDLLAAVDVSYFVGREANSKYQEIYNGIQFKDQHHKFECWIDPYKIEGDSSSGLLKGIQDLSIEELGYNGKENKTIQAYNFRICLTDDPENKLEFEKPEHYNPDEYELLARYINKGIWDAMKLNTPIPNSKYDLNNYGAFSTDYIGMNYDWPEGSYQEREEIYQKHVTYNQGLLYFLANDDKVPQEVKDHVNKFGLPKDEFETTGNWSPQLYIREARRMISNYVMTDKNCLGYEKVCDSIGMASYHMDSHNCRRFVIDGRVMNEGDVEIPVSPFEISYRSLVPKQEECSNLVVPVCLSSSHIAYGSIRMEPVFMITGQSAGVIATLAIEDECFVQNIPYEKLSEVLASYSQVLYWDESINDDPIARMKETFGDQLL